MVKRQVLITNKFGKYKWVTYTSFTSIVKMKTLSLLIINLLNAIISYDHDLGLIIRYRYVGVKVVGFKIYIGYVFRIVTTWAEYDLNHRMSHFDQDLYFEDTMSIHVIDIELFHEELIKLYSITFKV